MSKTLPPEGVEWAFTQMEVRKVDDGRFDIQISVLDTEEDIIFLSHQIGVLF